MDNGRSKYGEDGGVQCATLSISPRDDCREPESSTEKLEVRVMTEGVRGCHGHQGTLQASDGGVWCLPACLSEQEVWA